jgi:C4-type Zn-finger protein
MNNNPSYSSVTNKPVGCTFCGAQVQGNVTPIQNPHTKAVESICRWVCARCGNLVKMGKVG